MTVSISAELQTQKVLDHGYVKFIDSMGADESVIEAARMSTARGFERWDAGEVCKHCRVPRESVTVVEQRTSGVLNCKGGDLYQAQHEVADFVKTPGDAKLLEYLYSNYHHTPFEMGQIHVEVCAPIFVWRQWHRHRTFSYNEQSARYAPLPDLFYVPSEERMRDSFKASANKQAAGSGQAETSDSLIERLTFGIEKEQRGDRTMYEGRLNLGMAPELARLNVPVSQYSKCRVNTDLRNWLAFFTLRQEAHAQWEIRQYADACARLTAALFPRSYAMFEEYTLGSVRFSRSEIETLRAMVARLPALVDQVNFTGHPLYGDGNKARRAAFLKKLGLSEKK